MTKWGSLIILPITLVLHFAVVVHGNDPSGFYFILQVFCLLTSNFYVTLPIVKILLVFVSICFSLDNNIIKKDITYMRFVIFYLITIFVSITIVSRLLLNIFWDCFQLALKHNLDKNK